MTNDSSNPQRALTDVGILNIAVYIPRTAVSQFALEKHDNAPPGKYTIGLGQSHMSFVTDREDVISLCLTVVSHLVKSVGISYNDIGRLDVGTETVLDKSKSIKTSLMRLFKDSGNTEVEGLDHTNACYGGTAALFNALAWAESTAWDGRFALVVAADVAVYAPGPARPTGGAGAVAMLIGRGAPINFEIGLRATCMGDTYDFFKPRVDDEYPEVRGQETVDTFVHAMDECYAKYCERASHRDERPFDVSQGADYCVFHAPFNKMVRKSLAWLVYNDFMRTAPHADPFYSQVEKYRKFKKEVIHRNREAVQAFVKLASHMYDSKCAPAAWLAREIGNCYTASLYSSLAALLVEAKGSLIGKRILLYSFGSGFAASMYSLRVTSCAENVVVGPELQDQLAERDVVSAEDYVATLKQREIDYGRFGYAPKSEVETLRPGTWYLKEVREDGERDYDQVPYR